MIASSRLRSWAWPSSQGTKSTIICRTGSSTHNPSPGSGPAAIFRNSPMRCSVAARWAPSRTRFSYPGNGASQSAFKCVATPASRASVSRTQRPRNLRLDLAEFLVHRLDRHAQVLPLFLVRGMNAGTDSTGHQCHQLHDGREQQFTFDLSLGILGEEVVEKLITRGMLNRDARHDRQRRRFAEFLQNLCHAHGKPSGGKNLPADYPNSPTLANTRDSFKALVPRPIL